MPSHESDAVANARRQYLTAAVMTASPEKLVVMLYDGALRELTLAGGAIRAGARNVAGTHLRKALAIVGELRASLDLEAGADIAASLFSLYGFVSARILNALTDGAATPVEEARTVLSRLREGWEGITRGA